jgi:3-oxoacyl-[acyl-carrier-protein] synthase-1
MTDLALKQIRGQVEKALSRYGPGRIGVCFGSCDNGSEASLSAHEAYFQGRNGKDGGDAVGLGVFPAGYDLRCQGAPFLAEHVAEFFGISGPVFTVAAACASSAGAIIKGAQLIRAGLCGAVIAGGADIVSATVLLGFDSLEAISDTVSNPFSKNRKGINLGEAAAFFVMSKDKLEDEGIVLLGYGESSDAFHMTSPCTDGRGAARAMKDALVMAGIEGSAVDYVNLHGTGTRLNDRMEALAMNTVFAKAGGEPSALPPASSSKPVTGHTLGAAAALELALCWMVLYSAVRPAHTAYAEGTSRPDPYGGLPLHCWDGEYGGDMPQLCLVSGGRGAEGRDPAKRSRAPRVCMSNSFAFGGCNTSLILGRKEEP